MGLPSTYQVEVTPDSLESKELAKYINEIYGKNWTGTCRYYILEPKNVHASNNKENISPTYSFAEWKALKDEAPGVYSSLPSNYQVRHIVGSDFSEMKKYADKLGYYISGSSCYYEIFTNSDGKIELNAYDSERGGVPTFTMAEWIALKNGISVSANSTSLPDKYAVKVDPGSANARELAEWLNEHKGASLGGTSTYYIIRKDSDTINASSFKPTDVPVYEYYTWKSLIEKKSIPMTTSSLPSSFIVKVVAASREAKELVAWINKKFNKSYEGQTEYYSINNGIPSFHHSFPVSLNLPLLSFDQWKSMAFTQAVIPLVQKTPQYNENTNGWWLSRIADSEHRNQAIKNSIDQYGESILQRECSSIRSAINVFDWSNTPQRHDYWSKLADEYHRGNLLLLDKPHNGFNSGTVITSRSIAQIVHVPLKRKGTIVLGGRKPSIIVSRKRYGNTVLGH